MLGAPETVATGSTAESLNSGISTNEEIEETLNHTGISTSSKVMAGIVLGVGIVYTAVKTYRYFQSKVQNPIKKAIAAETTKALEVSPPMYAKTLWERFLLKAQGFVNRFS
jgi:predicted RND superfamily exporter protein